MRGAAVALVIGFGLFAFGASPQAPAASERPAATARPPAAASAVARCLSCHTGPDGALDIVGLAALQGLPPEWAMLFEDAFDLDGDGVAGRLRHVSGGGGGVEGGGVEVGGAGAGGVDAGAKGGGARPVLGVYGRRLAAGRLSDFARIAGAAHDIDLADPAVMDAVLDAFVARSPDPALPPPASLARFEARGCAACHVTRTFEHEGRTHAPLSDFLLHDLGEGFVRTAPLWGCDECLDAPGHGEEDAVE